MAKATLTIEDKPAVKERLAAARTRLASAHEAKDKVKARHARRALRLAKRDLRFIAGIPAPAAEESADEAAAGE